MADTFIMHPEWLESIAELPVEQQDKILAEIVRYGTGMPLQHEGDKLTQSFVNLVKGRIDYGKNKYSQAVELGKTGGKKKEDKEAAIAELVGFGLNSTKIAEILKCSKSSVDHSEAWRNRKKAPG